MIKKESVIIGGGPAGLAAAISLWENGIHDILILERDKELGGILNQCIHNGFGLHTFHEELTGPEYATRYIEMVERLHIPFRLEAMVTNITSDKVITVMSKEEGLQEIQAGTIILAMGCRERARGTLNTPGDRPAGVFTAGTAQYLVNRKGFLPGKQIVILGSGDIGLIMARRMVLEGAHVQAVVELMEKPGGLQRNVVQCLEDYGIPLELGCTVTSISGKKHIESVTIAKVDSRKQPIRGTEKRYACDTLLLSVGLIPENELSMRMGLHLDTKTKGPLVDAQLMTEIPGVFACGNVLHVHDLVDHVSKEAENAGRFAACYLKEVELCNNI